MPPPGVAGGCFQIQMETFHALQVARSRWVRPYRLAVVSGPFSLLSLTEHWPAVGRPAPTLRVAEHRTFNPSVLGSNPRGPSAKGRRCSSMLANARSGSVVAGADRRGRRGRRERRDGYRRGAQRRQKVPTFRPFSSSGPRFSLMSTATCMALGLIAVTSYSWPETQSPSRRMTDRSPVSEPPVPTLSPTSISWVSLLSAASSLSPQQS